MIKYETNSKKIKEGQIFVAIKGHTVDGHDYINSAIDAGAIGVIAEREVEASVPVTVVENSSEYLKEKLVSEYSDNFKNIKIVGVTGTNGKTTTCFLTYQLLNKLGIKCAYMGTIGFYMDDNFEELPNTTPEILTVYKLILKAIENDCKVFVMEVSSHAIDLDRIAGINYEIGAFTNLTEDHLDYHKTMDAYLNVKLKLVDKCNTFISNIDDEYGSLFLKNAKNSIELGINAKDYKINSFDISPDKTNINFSFNNSEYEVTTNLTSKFNIYNYLTALAITKNLGIDIKDIIDITSEIYPPAGRCETYKVGLGFAVIDYAHTPDAVEKVIDAYKELCKGRIITVIGCGGDRDPIKRPIMGNIATEKSDFVILTNDNPRTEDEKNIMNDILSGINKNNYKVIYDRKDAIKEALSTINENDIVLILGKGHEDYQIIGHDKIHLSDKEEVLKFIKEN